MSTQNNITFNFDDKQIIQMLTNVDKQSKSILKKSFNSAIQPVKKTAVKLAQQRMVQTMSETAKNGIRSMVSKNTEFAVVFVKRTKYPVNKNYRLIWFNAGTEDRFTRWTKKDTKAQRRRKAKGMTQPAFRGKMKALKFFPDALSMTGGANATQERFINTFNKLMSETMKSK